MSDQFNNYLCSRFPQYIFASSTHDDTTMLSTTELDSHADSPVVGKYCKILELTGKTVKVSGFTSDLGKPLEVPVVNAAVAYDCVYTGMTYILVIYNALYTESYSNCDYFEEASKKRESVVFCEAALAKINTSTIPPATKARSKSSDHISNDNGNFNCDTISNPEESKNIMLLQDPSSASSSACSNIDSEHEDTNSTKKSAQ